MAEVSERERERRKKQRSAPLPAYCALVDAPTPPHEVNLPDSGAQQNENSRARTPPNLLADWLSEQALADELRKDIRTVQRWRGLRIGPPFVMNGKTPLYHVESARAWLAAGGVRPQKGGRRHARA